MAYVNFQPTHRFAFVCVHVYTLYIVYAIRNNEEFAQTGDPDVLQTRRARTNSPTDGRTNILCHESHTIPFPTVCHPPLLYSSQTHTHIYIFSRSTLIHLHFVLSPQPPAPIYANHRRHSLVSTSTP